MWPHSGHFSCACLLADASASARSYAFAPVPAPLDTTQLGQLLTTGSRSTAASSPVMVFCTSACFCLSADGNACGEE